MQSVLTILNNEQLVQKVVIDFERAVWVAVQEKLPDATIQGCAFHWTQSLWRKIQDLGLQGAYSNDDAVFKFLRKVMTLPFLPATKIPGVFERLRAQASSTALEDFMIYVADQWIYNVFWCPENWSVFNQCVRTNNDIEGWHHRINRRASGKSHIPFYSLVGLLHQEAEITSLHIRLVSEKKLKRNQRRSYRMVQGRVFKLWEEYEAGERSKWGLLKACANLNYGPGRSV